MPNSDIVLLMTLHHGLMSDAACLKAEVAAVGGRSHSSGYPNHLQAPERLMVVLFADETGGQEERTHNF
jgi:hypothetical protein